MREDKFLEESSEFDTKKENFQKEGRGQYEEESLGERNVTEETNNARKMKEAEDRKDEYKWSRLVGGRQTREFRCVRCNKKCCAGVNIKGRVASILTC